MDSQLFNNPPKKENAAEPKKQGSFFSNKKPAAFGQNLSEMSGQVNNVSRRLRILEERYLNMRKKSQLTEQNMLSTNKKASTQIRDAFNEITEIRAELKKITDQLTLMNNELSECANRNDLMVVGKYIEFWEPINFLTEKEAKRIIKEYMGKEYTEKHE